MHRLFDSDHDIVCRNSRRRSIFGTSLHDLQSGRYSLLQTIADARLQHIIDREIDDILDAVELQSLGAGSDDLPLYDLVRYHLGRLDESLQPERSDAGKRIRPILCLRCCEIAGGPVDRALPVAAAIELLHNFTLIHDDIQDRSRHRRHRPTVWSLWGIPQAINAGDALFVLSHLAFDRIDRQEVDPDIVTRLSIDLHNTTLRIVEGQVLDIGFESREHVGVKEYLTMIGGKTGAIIEYACRAGALIAGTEPERVAQFKDFGAALGAGFQIQDDYLGVWGTPETTGKSNADDIRQRKKALPILLLADRASTRDRNRLNTFFRTAALDNEQVAEILEMMEEYNVRRTVQQEVETWHDRAVTLLEEIGQPTPARHSLNKLVERLAIRSV